MSWDVNKLSRKVMMLKPVFMFSASVCLGEVLAATSFEVPSAK